MNDDPTPDDLDPRFAALGESLRRPPRPDSRIEAALGAAPPVAGGVDDPTVVLATPTAAGPPRRRTAWLAVAAALTLLAGVGAAAYAVADEDPVLPAVAGEDDSEEDGDEDGEGASGEGDEADRPDDPAEGADDAVPETDDPDLAETVEEHHAWLECVTGRLRSMFEDGFPPADRRLPGIDECGEPPAIAGSFSDGFALCLEPDAGTDEADESCVHGAGKWFPFGELPDLDDLPGLDDLCSSETTDDGFEVECTWPPCDGDGTDCPFGGRGHFFFDPESLPDTFPDLPHDFEFPDDLPELDEWFENFPWGEKSQDPAGDPEPADA